MSEIDEGAFAYVEAMIGNSMHGNVSIGEAKAICKWYEQAKQPTVTEADIMLTSAVNSLIGFCEGLKAGDVITEGYAQRMKDYYIPNLLKALNIKVAG